jgi:hypothetical protein
MKLLPVLWVLCLIFQLIPFTETTTGVNDGSKKGTDKKGGTLKKVKSNSAEAFRKSAEALKKVSAKSAEAFRRFKSTKGNKDGKLKRSNSAPLSRKPDWVASSSAGGKKTGLRVLMVAPNQFKSHYALNKKLALLLLEQAQWVQEVVSLHIHIPARGIWILPLIFFVILSISSYQTKTEKDWSETRIWRDIRRLGSDCKLSTFTLKRSEGLEKEP